ncbi:MAG: haloacid dehalogenase [Chloroflexi bacterium]|nr:haloacid dehalogenase [Chloroflexota bacterium]
MLEYRTILSRTTALTFDCYGTLIDWETGLRRAFRDILGLTDGASLQTVFDAYLAAEARIEAGPYQPYRRVVALAVSEVAGALGVGCTSTQSEDVADCVGDWPVFADTGDALKLLSARFRLGVLSNVDRDLLARTLRQFPVTFDFLATAADVKSYKPAEAHFRRGRDFAGETGLHVAQSLYHDGVPARRLGIPFVWINRRGETNITQATPLASFPDLAGFARSVEEGLKA